MWDYRLWIVITIMVLLTLFGLSTADAADLPEYADLTFVDMADLDAQVDSVLAPCDTVQELSYVEVDSLWENYGVDIYNPRTITCRRWAGLTVWEMPKETWAKGLVNPRTGLTVIDVIPGKARLYWWGKED